MMRAMLLFLCLSGCALQAVAADDPPAPASAPAVLPLPAMHFLSTVAEDDLLAALQRNPALSGLDKDLVGSPLSLLVTHTSRPATGSEATGFISAVLSGSTLGLIPVVTRETLVVNYDVLLSGRKITGCSFEYTSSRAINIWAAGEDGYQGLGKAGMDWVKSTAAEAAAKLAADPAIRQVQDEISYYFPSRADGPG